MFFSSRVSCHSSFFFALSMCQSFLTFSCILCVTLLCVPVKERRDHSKCPQRTVSSHPLTSSSLRLPLACPCVTRFPFFSPFLLVSLVLFDCSRVKCCKVFVNWCKKVRNETKNRMTLSLFFFFFSFSPLSHLLYIFLSSGGLAAAASDMSPVIALPVVKAGSALANAAGTKIPVTLPRIHNQNFLPLLQQQQQQQQPQQSQQQVSFMTSSNSNGNSLPFFNLNALANNSNNNNNGNSNSNQLNLHPNHQPVHQPNFIQQAKTLSHVLSLIQPTPNPPSPFIFGRRRR